MCIMKCSQKNSTILVMFSIGIQSIKPTNNTAMTGKFICVVHHCNRGNILSQLEDLFDIHFCLIGDGREFYHQKSLKNFQQYLTLGYENCWPGQCQTTHNAVVDLFDQYIATHQPYNAPPDEPVSTIKRRQIDEKLIVMCLPDTFPGIFNLSSKVSPTVIFADTIHTSLSTTSNIRSDVTNISNGSTEKKLCKQKSLLSPPPCQPSRPWYKQYRINNMQYRTTAAV